MAENAKRPVKIFYCYAYKDKRLLNELDTHLATLKRQEQVISWYDQEIMAGREWAQEINKHLNDADIILLFISPDFIASDYSYGVQMDTALKRHSEGSAYVIPIILRPSDNETAPFSKLKSLPSNGRPVTKWSNRDEAMLNIIRGIRSVIKTVREKREESNKNAKKLTNPEKVAESPNFLQQAKIDTNTSTINTKIEEIDYDTTSSSSKRLPYLSDDKQVLQVDRKNDVPPLDLAGIEKFSLEKPKHVVEHTDKPIYSKLDTQNEQMSSKESAIQLSLPFDNLETQSKQKPISRPKKHAGGDYETLYIRAENLLADNQPSKGLEVLKDLNFEPIPSLRDGALQHYAATVILA